MKRGRWVVGLGVLGAGVAWACFDSPSTGVHFNTVVDFGAPPPSMSIYSWSEHPHRAIPGNTARWEDDYAARETLEERLRAAVAAESVSTADEAIAHYKEVLESAIKFRYPNPEDLTSEIVDFSRERLELLGKPNASVFFKALPFPDRPADLATLRKFESGSAISAHARYVIAMQTPAKGRSAAADAFLHAAELGGPRREPSLIMAARTLLDGSFKQAPTAQEVAKGRQILVGLLKEFPNSRFRWNAEGWLARCDLLAGARVAAMTGYMRQYLSTKAYEDRVRALSSMRVVFGKLTAADGADLRAHILADGTLLPAYLDYRLYHDSRTQIEPNEQTYDQPRKLKPGALDDLAKFAQQVVERHPATPIESNTLARLAEIAYQRGDYDSAAKFAQRSLAHPGERADLATYVLASVQRRQGQIDAARGTLADFEKRYAGSYLIDSAWEMRALLAEAKQDWTTALEIYHRLNYDYDRAYLLDVRVPTARLADIHPADATLADMVRFTYGMRLMRERKFGEAKRVFEAMPEATRKRLGHVGSHDYSRSDDPKSLLDACQDPLTTAIDLERLTADSTPAGRYALASYYYTKRNLLLYNAAAWDGSRSFAISFFWNEAIATPEDEEAMVRHHHEHECLYEARRICQGIAADAPNSSEAPLALYRVACSARRLAVMDGWWREREKKERLWDSAITEMDHVWTKYPSHPLAQNAKKYAGVFREEKKGAYVAGLFAARVEE